MIAELHDRVLINLKQTKEVQEKPTSFLLGKCPFLRKLDIIPKNWTFFLLGKNVFKDSFPDPMTIGRDAISILLKYRPKP